MPRVRLENERGNEMEHNAGHRDAEWSISDIARLTGTTSRTLRHYGDIGLLAATRTGANGYRYYNERALTRLQRILLLRDLGLGLPAIAEVLAGQTNDAAALATHLRWLRSEQNRLDRQIASVETTISKITGEEPLMAENMFDGFDHTVYKEEVEQRWGRDAYAASDAWWRSMSAMEKAEWMTRQKQLAADWIATADSGVPAEGPEAQALARRQFEWLRGIPGTPGDANGPSREYFAGLGEMYVADERFAVNYGGVEGATFVRDAMRHFAHLNV
jgi:DNA-binding transcriptional MerR regulator